MNTRFRDVQFSWSQKEILSPGFIVGFVENYRSGIDEKNFHEIVPGEFFPSF